MSEDAHKAQSSGQNIEGENMAKSKKPAVRKGNPQARHPAGRDAQGRVLYHGDARAQGLRADGPLFLGHVISHLVLDPRDGPHPACGREDAPSAHRIPLDRPGRTWRKRSTRPRCSPGAGRKEGRSVDHTFGLTPGRAADRDVWYAGTSPQGLFRSADGGVNWEPFSTINDDPQFREWWATVQDATPDGPKLHSIIVDSRNGAHFYIAMSGAACTNRPDGGRTGKRSSGARRVEGFGFDRPSRHSTTRTACGVPEQTVTAVPANHCRHLPPGSAVTIPGILARQEHAEVRSATSLPAGAASARRGYRDGCSPMDAPPSGRAPARREARGLRQPRNGGKSWQRSRAGCRRSGVVDRKRQAMPGTRRTRWELYFGTTTGELWMSRDEGRRWECIARTCRDLRRRDRPNLAMGDGRMGDGHGNGMGNESMGRLQYFIAHIAHSGFMKVLIPSSLRS